VYRNAPSEQFVGHEKIKAYIAQSNYQSCKFLIDTIDSQEKGKGEIIVLVTGMVIDAGKTVRPFCQTFYLEAVSGTRYIVRNDVLRFLSPDLLNIGESTPKVEPTAQPEVNEQPHVAEESELKHDVPIHVDMGTQADVSLLEPTKEPEPPSPVEQPVPAPTQIAPPQPQKKQTSRRNETKAHEEADSSKPAKPRAWSSVARGPVGQPSSAPAQTTTESPVAAIAADSAVGDEEEIATTPASAAAEKPKTTLVMNSLYVKNLGAGCDVEEIRTLFAQFGKVRNVRYTPQQSFCFVEFETIDAADKALKGGSLRLNDSA